MSKLIVLSNRVSLPNPEKQAAGGLAVALQDALQESGGIWLGWNGEKISHDQSPEFNELVEGQVQYLTCPLTEQQYQGYYCGFANHTLWPAMHERRDLIEYQQEEFEIYQQVNRLFAEKLQQIAAVDDVIWVHDYHFLSVAHYCRELGMPNKIGFFLHIPFAPLSIWSAIPSAQKLIEDLCCYDVIGLQTEQDESRCQQVCSSYLKTATIQQLLFSEQIHVKTIKCYPIGVDPEKLQHVAEQQVEQPQDIFDPALLQQQKTIIGVDRIDYSKGLLERFQAFAGFLEQYPEYQKRVTELQVACPCRMEIPVYHQLYDQLTETVSQINSELGQDYWHPIECTHQTIQHEKLMGLYRLSDICWINSLRDGMNLVAKEYVAAQNPEDPGVLILSKYTGAAEQMSQALIVDPQDPNNMIQTLKKALELSKKERIRRYEQLMQGLKAFDIHDWRNSFLRDLNQAAALPHLFIPHAS